MMGGLFSVMAGPPTGGRVLAAMAGTHWLAWDGHVSWSGRWDDCLGLSEKAWS